jgi:hypothetical protein
MATPTTTRGPRKVILSRKLVAISNNESSIASEVEAMVDVEEVVVVVTLLTPPIIRFAKKCSWAFLELPISSKCKAKSPFVILPMEDEEDVVLPMEAEEDEDFPTVDVLVLPMQVEEVELEE